MKTPPNMDQVRLTVANGRIAELEKLLRVTNIVAEMRSGKMAALEKMLTALIDSIIEYDNLSRLSDQGMSVNGYRARQDLMDALEKAQELLEVHNNER